MAIVASVLIMIIGLFITRAANTPQLAQFGWFLAAIGALGLVVNIYVLGRARR